MLPDIHPFVVAAHHFLGFVAHLFVRHEYPALFGLLLLEEAGVPLPIPGDTIVAMAGARHVHSLDYVLAAIAASSGGVFLGSSALYAVARRGGRPLLARYGRYIHLNERRLERMERWLRRHGAPAVFVGRLCPGLRTPASAIAGLSGVPYAVFAPVAAIDAVIWSSAYFWLGSVLQRHVGVLTSLAAGALDALSAWALALAGFSVLVAIPAAVGAAWYLRRRGRRRAPLAAPAAPVRPGPR